MENTDTAYIINLAPTGIVPTRTLNRNIPLNHSEILDDVAVCMELGVQMFHLHARDAQEQHTSNPEPYGRLIESIRLLPGGKDVVLTVTCSGRTATGFESRSRVLDLDGDMKPDMASLTPCSLNFKDSVSVNEPDIVRRLAQKMLEKGIKPEVEIFDLGMANFAKVLIKENLIKGRVYSNLLFGNIASAQATPLEMATLMNVLPEDWTVCVAGIGRQQLIANVFGLTFKNGVRVGLEDNLWLDSARTELASNSLLVKRVIRLANEIEKVLMPSALVRSSILC